MHSEAIPHFRGADLGWHGCLFFPGWLTMPAGFGFVFFFNLSKALPLSYILCVLGISISFSQSLTGFKVFSRQRTMRNMWKKKKKKKWRQRRTWHTQNANPLRDWGCCDLCRHADCCLVQSVLVWLNLLAVSSCLPALSRMSQPPHSHTPLFQAARVTFSMIRVRLKDHLPSPFQIPDSRS